MTVSFYPTCKSIHAQALQSGVQYDKESRGADTSAVTYCPTSPRSLRLEQEVLACCTVSEQPGACKSCSVLVAGSVARSECTGYV